MSRTSSRLAIRTPIVLVLDASLCGLSPVIVSRSLPRPSSASTAKCHERRWGRHHGTCRPEPAPAPNAAPQTSGKCHVVSPSRCHSSQNSSNVRHETGQHCRWLFQF